MFLEHFHERACFGESHSSRSLKLQHCIDLMEMLTIMIIIQDNALVLLEPTLLTASYGYHAGQRPCSMPMLTLMYKIPMMPQRFTTLPQRDTCLSQSCSQQQVPILLLLTEMILLTFLLAHDHRDVCQVILKHIGSPSVLETEHSLHVELIKYNSFEFGQQCSPSIQQVCKVLHHHLSLAGTSKKMTRRWMTSVIKPDDNIYY